MVAKYPIKTKKDILLSVGMLFIGLAIYFLVISFPPPILVSHIFVDFHLATAIFFTLILALILNKQGYLWEVIALTSTLLLFAMGLIYKWQVAMYDGSILGGILPWSDAREYYINAQLLLNSTDLNSFGARRPLFSGIFSVLLFITGNSLKSSISILVALNSLSVFYAAREIQKNHNAFSAAIFTFICFWFYYPFIGAVMSENLGLCLGVLSLALLLRWTQKPTNLPLILIGLFTLTTALNARAGAFFVLPFILAWIGLSSRSQKIIWLNITLGALAIASAIILNLSLSKLLASPGGTSFSNYSYTLYGLASGYTGWNQAIYDHPNATEDEIYKLAFYKIKTEPKLFAIGILKSYQDYFTPTNGAFSFMRLVNDENNKANNLFWGFTGIGLLSGVLWRKEKPYSLSLVVFFGILLSAGLLPPSDADSMRAYAATIPFSIYIISTVAGIPTKLINSQNDIDIQKHFFTDNLQLFASLLLIICFAGPFIVRWFSTPLKYDFSPSSCAPNQKQITFNIGNQSGFKIVKNKIIEDYLPYYGNERFQSDIFNGPAYGFYKFLDDEFIKLKAGNSISIGTYNDNNSHAVRIGYLITLGNLPNTGPHNICVTPSTHKELLDIFFYQADNNVVEQDDPGIFSQNKIYWVYGFRYLFGLGVLIVLFFLQIEPGKFIALSLTQRMFNIAKFFVITAGVLIYLHQTAILPLAWERKELNVRNSTQVEGYLYKLPLGLNWMDQKTLLQSPVVIYEDGIPLEFPESKFFAIKNLGRGRFTIQSGFLFFSTTNNSDPRYNEKHYEIYWPTPIYPLTRTICYVLALIGLFISINNNQNSNTRTGPLTMSRETGHNTINNKYQETRQTHWDSIAQKRDHWRGMGKWYHRRLIEIYQYLVNPNQRVLEIGCGTGSLLARLRPSRGVGIDFSAEMIARAKQHHPELEYYQIDAHDLSSIEGEFDVIILSDTVNDLWDVQLAFDQIRKLCTPHTRVIINFYSHLWQIPLTIAQSLNLAAPMLNQNWLTPEDIDNMLHLSGFESIRASREILWPLPLGGLANRYLVKLWPFNAFALSNFIIARPAPQPAEEPSVSVVIAARNEAGNVKAIFERVPQMGKRTEIVFVEGHSRDNTYETIADEIPLHPSTPSLLFRQPGIGKADAIRLGFEKATGDILMILDADLTVPPEDLPRFYDAIVSGKGEFINGVRLVYPMEKEAMRTLNFIGNKLFSMAFSWMLGQPIKDTLCGTKVMWSKDYAEIAANRSYFGDFDPFGDFDLIFGAAKLNRKIIDLPIRYRDRTYGTTNISRWKHGLLLLRMVAFAARRIKFV